MKNGLKFMLVTLLLIIVIRAYVYVYMDFQRKYQELFIKYFENHIEQLEAFYFEPDDGTLEKYKTKLAEILIESKFNLDEFVEVELNNEIKLADKFKLTTNEKAITQKIASFVKEFFEDEQVLKLCKDNISEEQIQNIKLANENYIQEIDKIDENSELKIYVYVKEGKAVRTDLISKKIELSYQLFEIDGKNSVEFVVKQNEKEEKYVFSAK